MAQAKFRHPYNMIVQISLREAAKLHRPR